MLLIVTGAASVVAGGLVFAAHRRRSLSASEGPKELGTGGASHLLERGIRDLRVDDVVQYDGRDFLVEGVIRYEEAGHRWLMGRMIDGRDIRWLLVGLERAGQGSARMLQDVGDLELSGYPPEVLVRGDTRYSFDKRGTATTSISGESGGLAGGGGELAGTVQRCRWWNYEGAGRACLLVEQWGDDYRALEGRAVSEADLEMMPGS
jgi:hypothetical protein